MSDRLYREFVLHGPAQAKHVWQLLKNNAAAQAQKGKPLRVIVTEDEAKRGLSQNRFYWGAVITPISEQAWVAGQQFDKDAWHEMYARKFGVCVDVTLPDGEVVVKRLSTAEMGAGEFASYCTQVQAHAAAEYGVEFQ